LNLYALHYALCYELKPIMTGVTAEGASNGNASIIAIFLLICVYNIVLQTWHVS